MMNRTTSVATYTLRPSTPADFEFCYRLNERNMRTLVERLRGWNEAAERASFATQFRAGIDAIVVVGGRDVGHLGVDEDDGAGRTRLCMIALAPEIQRRGIGTAIIRDVLCAAHAAGRNVVLRVTEENLGARRLYERLGFHAARELDESEKRTRKIEMVADAPGRESSPGNTPGKIASEAKHGAHHTAAFRRRNMRRVTLWTVLLVMVPVSAQADASIPMLVLVWPGSILLLGPIIAIEAWYGRRLGFSHRQAWSVSAKANLVSTLVGIPLTWAAMLVWEIVIFAIFVDPYGRFNPDPSRLVILVASTVGAAWIGGGPPWTLPLASASLCIPFYFVSVPLEAWVARRALPADLAPQAKLWSRGANRISYGLLIGGLLSLALILALLDSASSGRSPTGAAVNTNAPRGVLDGR